MLELSEMYPGTENVSFLLRTERQEAWRASKHLWKYAGGDIHAKVVNVKAVQWSRVVTQKKSTAVPEMWKKPEWQLSEKVTKLYFLINEGQKQCNGEACIDGITHNIYPAQSHIDMNIFFINETVGNLQLVYLC